MHPDTYEQEIIDKQFFGDMYDYFVEDMEAILSFHEGEVVAGTHDAGMTVQSDVLGHIAVISSCRTHSFGVIDSSECFCNRCSASTSFVECCQHRYSGKGR